MVNNFEHSIVMHHLVLSISSAGNMHILLIIFLLSAWLSSSTEILTGFQSDWPNNLAGYQ